MSKVRMTIGRGQQAAVSGVLAAIADQLLDPEYINQSYFFDDRDNIS